MPTPPDQPALVCPESRLHRAAPWLVVIGLLAVSALALRIEGRIWWCACGTPRPWVSDVWTSHCSQHLSDPYSITHVAHGLIFYMLLAWLAPRMGLGWRLSIAVAVAAAWEVLENSPPVIERYRTATMSLEYMGDSVVNATGDVLSCILGFFIAHRVGLLAAGALLVVSEVVLAFWIRDNLTLNVIMLIHPIDAIREWQTAGQGAA